MNFSGSVILVTGASGGLGKTVADILHQMGATVIGIYNQNKIDTEYENYKCNIASEEEIKETINKIINRHEKIDAVVNCAATTHDGEYYEITKESFLDVLSVNLVGTFLVCKYALEHMDSGVIINVSSTDATDTYSSLSMDYAASKAGLENITKNLANRVKNVKICGIAPSWIDTDAVSQMDPHYLESELNRTNQSRLLKKEEVAVKIIEMIVNNDDYVSGEIIRMDVPND